MIPRISRNAKAALADLALRLNPPRFNEHGPSRVQVELLGIPKEIKFGAMIPIGWPQNDFVKVKRKPIASVIHWDKWSD